MPRDTRPYNTRRKSLSLPSLGIHLPVSNAARAAAANRAIAQQQANSDRTSSPTGTVSDSSAPPTKRMKRAHTADMDDAPSSEPLPKKHETVKFENTPPPSPGAERRSIEDEDEGEAGPKTIDLEGINDEIVEAVIVQLQTTGNRPHLVKELAAVLMQQLKIVQQSANPCAIISSRLASYLKRPCWSALAPCPLAKELESVHPRRTYFYLTTCPHQPLPDPAQATTLSQLAHMRTIISPALSSAASSSEDADMERRRELSPSPEVDLSSPEFDDMDDDVAMPTTPIGSLSLRGFGMQRGIPGRRAASPPLEKDEKEFTQTADGLQKRKLSGDLLSATTNSGSGDMDYCVKDDAGLFGEKASATMYSGPIPFVASPAMRPSTMSLNFGKRDADADSWLKLESMLEWDRSPENIELDELDCLLNDY
ncbi:hypothetical protein OQA88_9644 [Cercophora sp. LCS_1]